MELKLVLMAICCLLVAQIAFANPNLPPASFAELNRLRSIAKQLRCSTCQNTNLFEASSSQAQDTRQEILELIKDGTTDSDILEHLRVTRGEYALFRPAFNYKTYMLWAFPFIIVLIGAWTLCRFYIFSR